MANYRLAKMTELFGFQFEGLLATKSGEGIVRVLAARQSKEVALCFPDVIYIHKNRTSTVAHLESLITWHEWSFGARQWMASALDPAAQARALDRINEEMAAGA